MTTRQTAIIYARVSSKDQKQTGFSIPSQFKLLRGYAKAQKFSILHEFEDDETAKKAGRTDFENMVRFLAQEATNPREAACRILLVEKTDRLYRNLKDYATLDDLDIEIHLVKEHTVLTKDSNSDAQFMHGIRVLMARKYIQNLSEEVKKGQTEKAEQGIYPSVAPIGYLNVECNKHHVIQPDLVLGPLIRHLFQCYATGRYSLLDLVQKAHEDGLVFPRSGKKIYKGSLHRLLQNPMYYGDFLWKGKRYHGSHEPLVSKELFDRVQTMLYERSQRRMRKQKYEWAFQGMLTCGHCGCALTAEIKKQKYVYYHCTGHKGNCPERKYAREQEIDRQFTEALRAIRLDDDVLEWVVKALKESHHDEKAYHDQQITSLQRQHTKLQHRLDAMYIDKLDGTISQEFYDKKCREWRDEQDTIFANIEKHQNANRTYLDEGIKLLELSQQAVRLYKSQPLREKRRLLHCVFSNSIWKDGRLSPKYRQPFKILAVTNRAYQQTKAVSPSENDLRLVWRGRRDSNSRPPA